MQRTHDGQRSATGVPGRLAPVPQPARRPVAGDVDRLAFQRAAGNQAALRWRRSGDETSPVTAEAQAALMAPGRPLEPALRSAMEASFGQDFGRVRVHAGARAAASATAQGARAYTVGSDIAFAAGAYAPHSREGQRLIAHELGHVVTQRGGPAVLQRQPVARPATEQERREFIEDTAIFLEGSASYFQNAAVPLSAARFETLINTWYQMVIEDENLIAAELGDDRALHQRLQGAYSGAIRVLIQRAAQTFGRSEADLYNENRGRIPMWAWRTPHHLEPGITTPVVQGQAVDPLTGHVDFSVNGIDVAILPNTVRRGLARSAETTVQSDWGAIQAQTRNGRVTGFNGPGRPRMEIQTAFRPGVSAAGASAYGRGTTPQDIAGARVTPASGSLGFHEGSHGLDYVEFLTNNPPPQFTGAIGMTAADFQRAMDQWNRAVRDYDRRLHAFSLQRTDCVGTTIDVVDAQHQVRGRRFRPQCPP